MKNKINSTIAFVILGYNCIEDTVECIDSIVKYEPNAEVYFLDNCSLDDTKKVVTQKYSLNKKVHLLFSPTNLGVSGGRNYLLELVKEDIIVILDNDAYLTKAISPKMLEVLSNPSVGMYGQWGLLLDDTFEVYSKRDSMLEVDAVTGYCQCFKRQILDQIGLLDINFKFYGSEDVDFCLRIKQLGYKIISDNLIPVVHKEHRSSSTLKGLNKYSADSTNIFKQKWKGYELLLEVSTKSLCCLKCDNCNAQWSKTASQSSLVEV